VVVMQKVVRKNIRGNCDSDLSFTPGWALLTGGHCSEVVVKTGLTVLVNSFK
jgi:hypothetical protein